MMRQRVAILSGWRRNTRGVMLQQARFHVIARIVPIGAAAYLKMAGMAWPCYVLSINYRTPC